MAVDTLGQLLAIHVTPANEQDRHQVQELTQQVQQVTEETVEVAFVDSGYTGKQAAADAEQQGIQLEVVKLPQAKKGFILLPKRWIVEPRPLPPCHGSRVSASAVSSWMSRFRRLARDYERLAVTLVGFHLIAFVILMVRQYVSIDFTSA